MSKYSPAREEIFAALRSALGSPADTTIPPLPDSARFSPRNAETPDLEAERMIREVERLSGRALNIRSQDEFVRALEALIRDEFVRTAVLSGHPFHESHGVTELLKRLGVDVVSPESDRRRLADCDLGITVADAALPETGTSLLRTTQGQPDVLSLLPRIHLVLVPREALKADMQQAFAAAKNDRHFVLVSGCSRTADIEKVLTLGVHGPKSFHVWICS